MGAMKMCPCEQQQIEIVVVVGVTRSHTTDNSIVHHLFCFAFEQRVESYTLRASNAKPNDDWQHSETKRITEIVGVLIRRRILVSTAKKHIFSTISCDCRCSFSTGANDIYIYLYMNYMNGIFTNIHYTYIHCWGSTALVLPAAKSSQFRKSMAWKIYTTQN